MRGSLNRDFRGGRSRTKPNGRSTVAMKPPRDLTANQADLLAQPAVGTLVPSVASSFNGKSGIHRPPPPLKQSTCIFISFWLVHSSAPSEESVAADCSERRSCNSRTARNLCSRQSNNRSWFSVPARRMLERYGNVHKPYVENIRTHNRGTL
jgi:hypothetical protein